MEVEEMWSFNLDWLISGCIWLKYQTMNVQLKFFKLLDYLQEVQLEKKLDLTITWYCLGSNHCFICFYVNLWAHYLQMSGIDNIFNFVGVENHLQYKKSLSKLTYHRRHGTDLHFEWDRICLSFKKKQCRE